MVNRLPGIKPFPPTHAVQVRASFLSSSSNSTFPPPGCLVAKMRAGITRVSLITTTSPGFKKRSISQKQRCSIFPVLRSTIIKRES